MERKCVSCGADPGVGSFCQHCGTPQSGNEAPEGSDRQSATPPTAPTPPAPAVQQTPPKRKGFRTGCLIIGVVALVVIAAGVFFAWRFFNNEILPGIQETTDQFTSLNEAPPGPCYDLETEDGVLTAWTEVSCDGSRQAEVSFAALFEEGPYPGDQYLFDTAADTCLTAFENYVGVSPEQSAYDVDWLMPTEAMWADGVRKGICLVVADDGSLLTGTVKGSET